MQDFTDDAVVTKEMLDAVIGGLRVAKQNQDTWAIQVIKQEAIVEFLQMVLSGNYPSAEAGREPSE